MSTLVSTLVLGLLPMAAAVPAASAGQQLLLSRPAAAGAMADGALIVLSPDSLAVEALDLSAGGARVWRNRLPSGGLGAERLLLLGGVVAAVGRDRLHLLDVITGSLKRTIVTGAGGDACALQQRGGACGLRCPCSFQLLDCETGADLGARHTLLRVAQLGPGGGRDRQPTCLGEPGGLVTQAGGRVVVTFARHAGGGLHLPTMVGAWRLADGTPLWSRAAKVVKGGGAAAFSGSFRAGGRGFCWRGDHGGRLSVFDCATGDVLWVKAKKSKGERPMVVAAPEAAALLVRDGDSTALRRVETGASAWRINAPSELVLPARASGRWDLKGADADGVRLVDLADGASLATLGGRAVGKLRLVASDHTGEDPMGWLLVGESGLARYAIDGRERARRPLTPITDVTIGQGAIAVYGSGRITVLDRFTLLPLAEFNDEPRRSVSVIGIEGALGRGVICLFVSGGAAFDPKVPETYGEVRIVRFR